MPKKVFLVVLLLSGNLSLFAQQQTTCPCCIPEARQFDFWIGAWETYTQDGKLAGRNHIAILQDSCILQENWVSNQGAFTGTSYNFYNRQSGKWQQLWLDNQGGNLQLEGGLENGKMVMKSKAIPNRQGNLQIDRITWTPSPDGTVRQLWEASTDQGKTWAIVFDGLYKRKK